MADSHPLLDGLLGGIYHCTSYEQFRKVVTDGVIQPTGNTPFTFDQTKSSFALEIKAVSLLALLTPSKSDCLTQGSSWSSLFTKAFPTMAIRFDEKLLTQKELVPNCAAALWNANPGNPYRSYIPKVESWYQGNLPLQLMTACIVTIYVPKGKDKFIEIQPGSSLLDTVRTEVLRARKQYGENPWKAAF